MVAVAEGKDEEVAEFRFGISDIREGWIAADLVAEADPVAEHAVEGLGVLAGVGCGGGLESSAERSVAYASRAAGVAGASVRVANSAG